MNRYLKNNIGEKNRIYSAILYIVFSLFFILMALVAPTFSPLSLTPTIAEASSGPVINFPEDSWDFGEITPDELPTHIFEFKNLGDELLIINGTKVSCESCIDPLISTKELNPGEEGELKITVNSLDMIGRFTKRIYVESNDLDHPRTIITVSGFIRDSKQTPFTIGKYYFSQGEYDKAIIEFGKSIGSDPDHTESYYYLGQCYLQKGIIEYNNKNISAYISLFRKAYKISGQAIPLYKKIIEENPTDLDSYFKLGYIYEIRSNVPFINEYDKALEYYLKALGLATSLSSARNTGITIYLNTRIGYIYFEKKKYSQAIEYLEQAEKLSPHNASIEVYYYLGLSYNKIGEKEKAQEFLSRVIELAPQSEFAQEAEKELKKMD